MKKTLLLTALAIASLGAYAQDNLLANKPVRCLGEPMIWEGTKETFNFDESSLQLITVCDNTGNPSNTSTNVYLYPQIEIATDNENYRKTQSFYIDMEGVYEISTLNSFWEGAYGTKYNIFLTNDEPSIEILETEPVMLAEGSSETQIITLPEDSKGQYLVIQVVDARDWGWGVKLRNMSAVGPFEETISSFDVAPNFVYMNEGTSLAFTYFNQVGLKFTDEDIEMSVKEGDATLTGGVLTVNSGRKVTLSAKLGDVEVTNDVYVAIPFNEEEIAAYRWKEGVDSSNVPENAIDQDATSYYEYNGDWGGGEAWLIVDLGKSYAVNAIGADFGSAGGSVVFAYSDENTVTGPVDKKWTEIDELNSWSKSSPTKRTNDNITYVNFDNPVSARYVAVYDTDNPQKPQLFRMYISGQEIQETEAASIEIDVRSLLFFGETETVSYLVRDQYGMEFTPDEEVALSVDGPATIADGVITVGNEKGTIKLTATVGNAVETVNITVADVDDYCMTGATITCDNMEADLAAVVDGGKDPAKHGKVCEIVGSSEGAGPHNHWLMAELPVPYDLDGIIAIWEGAAPRDYDVYVGTTEDDLTMLYSVTGHGQKTWYDRFAGQEMKNVKFIKINTTYNATGYGIKLYDLKAYGTPAPYTPEYELSVTVSAPVASVGEDVTVTAELRDQYIALPADDVKLTVEGPGIETAEVTAGNVHVTQAGTYTVTATFNDITAKATIKVLDTPVEETHGQHTVTADGAEDSFSFNIDYSAEPKSFSSSYVINLAYPHDLDLIKFHWSADAAPADYTVEFTNWDGQTFSVQPADSRVEDGGKVTDRVYTNVDTDNARGIKRKVDAADVNLYQIKKVNITVSSDSPVQLYGIDSYGVESNQEDLSGIRDVMDTADADTVDVVSLQGVVLRRGVDRSNAVDGLPAGLYIVGNAKVVVR